MDWLLIEKFLSSGQAFVPINIKNEGDSVQLYYQNGTTEVLNMKSTLFLSKLLHYFGTSISANRNRYGKLVGRRQLVPLYFVLWDYICSLYCKRIYKQPNWMG